MYRVKVTAADRRSGKAGDCFSCALAIALQRATGDDHANVYERDWVTYLEVHGRHIVADYEVRRFVVEFDAQPRRLDKTVVLPRPLPKALQTFAFTLPDFSDPQWQEQCYGCEELFDPKELNDEGECGQCGRDSAGE